MKPLLSVILASYNRREVVLNTLERLRDVGLDHGRMEILVVDNASTDGTASALRDYPEVTVVPLRQNLGSCAKSLGVDKARGQYLLFLDDDSYPRSGCLEAMLERFEADPKLAAAGFTVHLPDGSQECSALPHVFVGCGVGLRASAVRQVGGLDVTLFMQAEEYDLSFRLMQAGWNAEVFGDLAVDHLKSPQARRSSRTTFFDVRNNLRVVARYLPRETARQYRNDWVERYSWLAQAAGLEHQKAFARGLAAGRLNALVDRFTYRVWRLSPEIFERIFRWEYIAHEMQRLANTGVRRVILADHGKNIYAFFRGARAAGIHVVAIADDRLALDGRCYRDIPVMTVEESLCHLSDAYVVSNTSYVHAARRQQALSRLTARPVMNWFPAPASAPQPRPAALVS